jgi:hypothetical protein
MEPLYAAGGRLRVSALFACSVEETLKGENLSSGYAQSWLIDDPQFPVAALAHFRKACWKSPKRSIDSSAAVFASC